MPLKCMPNSVRRPARRLWVPSSERLDEEHELHERHERERGEPRGRGPAGGAGERGAARADGQHDDRGEEHRVAVAVCTAEAGVRDRADAGEGERCEQTWPAQPMSGTGGRRRRLGSTSPARETVQVHGRQEQAHDRHDHEEGDHPEHRVADSREALGAAHEVEASELERRLRRSSSTTKSMRVGIT